MNTNKDSEQYHETKSTLPNYDKILKELQVIETIFHSQMNPDVHLGSGEGFPRYCNEIFIISDVELLKISDYKIEYTSRIEQSKNPSLVINELKTIYKKSIELYNFFVTNLYNHPDKKEFFVGEDARQQIINSTGYYNFINYRASFRFFEVEQDSEFMNSINSKFFKNGFRYNYKNETLVNFCSQLIEYINLSEVLIENKTILIKQTQNGIMKAKDYISLIVNSYFDAQESLGNDPELIDLVKDLFKQTLLRVGKKQEQENYMTTNEYNSRIYFALEAMKDCGYYDGWEITNNTEFMRIETIIKDIERPISRIEFKNIGDWIDEITSVSQQPEPEAKGSIGKPKKDFKDFFKENISNSKIQEIQNKYKEYDGKKMTYLIYVLHKDFDIIAYSPNNRTESRKYFVDALIGNDSKKIMSGINKLFNTNDVTLNVSDYLNDNDYITIKKDIQLILEPIK